MVKMISTFLKSRSLIAENSLALVLLEASLGLADIKVTVFFDFADSASLIELAASHIAESGHLEILNISATKRQIRDDQFDYHDKRPPCLPTDSHTVAATRSYHRKCME